MLGQSHGLKFEHPLRLTTKRDRMLVRVAGSGSPLVVRGEGRGEV